MIKSYIIKFINPIPSSNNKAGINRKNNIYTMLLYLFFLKTFEFGERCDHKECYCYGYSVHFHSFCIDLSSFPPCSNCAEGTHRLD